jgi:hypothetical protein
MLLEDCPLCKLIAENRSLQKGNYCCKIDKDGNTLVVGSDHKAHAGFQGYLEACDLLLGDGKSPANGIIKEVMDWPGHWAVELKILSEGAGKSIANS